jgi:hypothetical protein
MSIVGWVSLYPTQPYTTMWWGYSVATILAIGGMIGMIYYVYHFEIGCVSLPLRLAPDAANAAPSWSFW